MFAQKVIMNEIKIFDNEDGQAQILHQKIFRFIE